MTEKSRTPTPPARGERKLACWKTQGLSEVGEGYFFARGDLEALRAALEDPR